MQRTQILAVHSKRDSAGFSLLGYSVENEWIFGAFLMSLNAAFVQIKNIGVLLTISLIVVDRLVVIIGGSFVRSIVAVVTFLATHIFPDVILLLLFICVKLFCK